MPAITWQNVRGPSLAEAAGPLAAATQGINNVFGQLKDVLKESEQTDATNWQTQKANNTNAFLEAVSKYTDPEKLKADQADPNSVLNTLRAQFGNQVDADKVRGAADARVAQTMQQARDSIAYQDVMRNEKTAPLVDQYKDAVMRKDPAGIAAARAAYLAAGGRNAADLDVFSDHRTRELQERQQHDESHLWNINTAKSTIDHQRAEEGIGRTQAAAATSSAASQAQSVKQQGQYQTWQMNTATEAAEAAKLAGKTAAYTRQLAASGNTYAKEGIYDGSQSDELRKVMKDYGIGDNTEDQANIIKFVNKLVQTGIKVKSPDGTRTEEVHELPMALVKAAISGSKDSLTNVGWNDGFASDVKKTIESAVQNSFQEARDPAGHKYLRSKYTADLEQFKSALTDATNNAQPLRPILPSTQVPGSRRK